MIVYFFLVAILPIAYLSSLSKNPNVDRLALIIIASLVIFISGFRWASDIDYMEYYDMYIETPTLDFFDRDSIAPIYGEPGYLFFSSLFKSFGIEFPFFALICVAFAVCMKIKVAHAFTRYAAFAIYLYLCVNFVTIEFIQIRWAVATGFIGMASLFLYRSKSIFAGIFMIVAVSLHYFSIAYIFVLLIVKIKSDKIFNLIVLTMSIVGIILFTQSVYYTGEIDSEHYIVQRLGRYLTEIISSVGILSFCKLALYPFCYYIATYFDKDLAKDPSVIFLKRIGFTCIALVLLLSCIPMMHFRAAVLADFYSAILMSKIIESRVSAWLKVTFASALIGMFTVWYVVDVSNYIESNRLFEYKIWIDIFSE